MWRAPVEAVRDADAELVRGEAAADFSVVDRAVPSCWGVLGRVKTCLAAYAWDAEVPATSQPDVSLPDRSLGVL